MALALALGVAPQVGLVATARAAAPEAVTSVPRSESIPIPGGLLRPLYRQPVPGTSRDTLLRRVVPVKVAPFEIDRRPVTNIQFLAFVREHPEWRRSKVSRLYGDKSYLAHWRADLEPGPAAPAESPVVNVSWFAARAYCAAHGKRLPTVAEWELVAAADEKRADATRDPAFLERLRHWYGHPAPSVLPAVGKGFRNRWGIEDLHGLVWEWTLDFNSALVTGESRGDASLERSLYCGAGASNASDFSDYAAFMRFAFRSSLEANYTTATLGFRGARDAARSQARSR